MLFVVDIVSHSTFTEQPLADHMISRLLVRHPPILERLRQEVTTVIGSSSHITREALRKMPYLNCIIKECKLKYHLPDLR